jgi:hypothetical protein
MEVIPNTQTIEKPSASISISYFVGGIQLLCILSSFLHDGSSDTNTMLIWYVVITIPSLIVHSITYIRIKLFVGKMSMYHYKLLFGHYMFIASLLFVLIYSLLIEYTNIYS